MKKFLAIGITTLGGFGLLGMGATTASATTAPTAHQLVCTSAGNQLIALQTPLAAATANQTNNTGPAAATALAAVGTAEATYITDAFVVIDGVDSTPPATAPQQAANVSAFNSAVTAFVNAVVASSAANVADFNAKAQVTQLTLQHTVLTDMQTQACA
jgi:hypothetical protein